MGGYPKFQTEVTESFIVELPFIVTNYGIGDVILHMRFFQINLVLLLSEMLVNVSVSAHFVK